MTEIPPRFKRQGGVTLLELMVYIALLGIVSTALVQMLRTNLQAYESTEASLVLKQDMRAAMNLMVREIRMAGCDPMPDREPSFGIVSGTAQSIQFTSDFDPLVNTTSLLGGDTVRKTMGDGLLWGPGEDVTYFLDDEGAIIRRAIYQRGQGFADEVLLDNVTTLQFNYFSTDPDVASGSTANTHFVEVIIEAQSNYVNRFTGERPVMRMATKVHLRNRKCKIF